MDTTVEQGYRERITALVNEAYQASAIAVEPLRHKILVKVLPRESVSASGIWMPQKQNKILLEGVVLATYKPFWQLYRKGEGEPQRVLVEPSVSPGDHVLWVHYEGHPVTPLTDEYRLINEDVIQARLDYEGTFALEDELDDIGEVTEHDARKILEKFHVIRKDLHCLTLSGV